MKRNLIIPMLIAIMLLVIAGGVGLAQERTPSDRINGPAGIEAALGTEFTYQGQLIDGSTPANGTYDLRFSLYDDPTAGIQVGSALPVDDDVVSDGLFTVQLDFGSGIFVGDALYLQVDVRPGASTGSYTSLAPRQPLTAAPYANFAQRSRWSGLIGMPSGFADGIDDDTTYSAGTGLSLSGTEFRADTNYMQRRVVGTCPTGSSIRVVNANGSVACEADNDTTYSAGTGLHEDQGAFNVLAAYQLPQGCSSGEVAKYNEANGTWHCAVDNSGSGGSFWSLTGNLGTNPATDYVGTGDAASLTLAVNATPALRLEPTSGTPNLVGGDANNAVATGAEGATIGGGGTSALPNAATGNYTAVSGGLGNSGGGNYAAIAGGLNNSTSANYAAIGGGLDNSATSLYSAIAGGNSNSASASYATIAGGSSNSASALYAAVGGGTGNSATANYAVANGGIYNAAGGVMTTVGGGYNNSASGQAATISGGESNSASGDAATIAGGFTITVTSDYAAVGGGANNQVSAAYGTVGGGEYNQAGDNDGNPFNDNYATVGGGRLNIASGPGSTIGGGGGNAASGFNATIGGGGGNTASSLNATIGGGFNNTASGLGDTTVAGGYNNSAGGDGATIGGGNNNTASGLLATIPGGVDNEASGDYSFAAGRRAKANSDGCFVWADTTDADFACDIIDSFQARASGGIYLFTNSSLSAGSYLDNGGSSWNSVSDRARKENLAVVDTAALLTALENIEISTWNYIEQDDAIRHIGPMAQDFNALVPGLGGEGEKYINSLDADGVALAAIQALAVENSSLRQQVGEMEARLAVLELEGQRTGSLSLSGDWYLWIALLGTAGFSVGITRRRRAQ